MSQSQSLREQLNARHWAQGFHIFGFALWSLTWGPSAAWTVWLKVWTAWACRASSTAAWAGSAAPATTKWWFWTGSRGRTLSGACQSSRTGKSPRSSTSFPSSPWWSSCLSSTPMTTSCVRSWLVYLRRCQVISPVLLCVVAMGVVRSLLSLCALL